MSAASVNEPVVADLPHANWRIRICYPSASAHVLAEASRRERRYAILDAVTRYSGLTTGPAPWYFTVKMQNPTQGLPPMGSPFLLVMLWPFITNKRAVSIAQTVARFRLSAASLVSNHLTYVFALMGAFNLRLISYARMTNAGC
jgi:hypothetical protein